MYTDQPRNMRFRGGWWMQDWPAAETHFLGGIERLTRIDAGPGVTVDLFTEDVFDYPWLYVTQAGYWDLSEPEIDTLRRYLLRGGFLVADDFFGEREWLIFQDTLTRVFPSLPLVTIEPGDEVLHVLYDVDQFTQIPGRRHIGCFRGGRIDTGYLPAPEWKGVYDEQGRLVVAANYNQDIGDAWEHADDPCYPEPMTALAYRFGINYIIYSMSH